MSENPTSSDEIKKDPQINDQPGNPVAGDLYADPEYLKLLDTYQQAQFDTCADLFGILIKRYPEHPRLIEFQKNLDMQLSLKKLETQRKKGERRQKLRKTLKMILFTIFSIIIISVIFTGSYFFLTNLVSQKASEDKLSRATQLEQQANDLLNSGQPAVAVKLVEMIRSMDAEYPGLVELETRTYAMLDLEGQYKGAISLLAEGKNAEALIILQEIESKAPGLWDVQQLIVQADEGIQIAAFLQEGNQYYQAQYWGRAIEAYESALALNPDLNDAQMKEQLLNSYLRSIIQMMESSSASVEDIGLAEQYYRKAMAMIPQSRAFASERGNLEQVSSNLLEVKFTQTAYALLQERYQTFSSISSAVTYLNKAVNLNPKNTDLQNQLKNAQLYQVAFQDVLDLNWNQAVKNLSQLVSSNPAYANGNASQLLLQSYYSLGKKYLEVGLYADARTFFEQAEILAFDKSDNLLQLYQVQKSLGDVIARTEDYENAASYYRYAFNKVDVLTKAPADSELYKLVSEGNGFWDLGEFQPAVELYQKANDQISQIYTLQTVKAPDGATLPFFAADNLSTTEAIINLNNLPLSMTITFGRDLQVPSIVE